MRNGAVMNGVLRGDSCLLQGSRYQNFSGQKRHENSSRDDGHLSMISKPNMENLQLSAWRRKISSRLMCGALPSLPLSCNGAQLNKQRFVFVF